MNIRFLFVWLALGLLAAGCAGPSNILRFRSLRRVFHFSHVCFHRADKEQDQGGVLDDSLLAETDRRDGRSSN